MQFNAMKWNVRLLVRPPCTHRRLHPYTWLRDTTVHCYDVTLLQVPTGLEIVGKVFEFTKWP